VGPIHPSQEPLLPPSDAPRAGRVATRPPAARLHPLDGVGLRQRVQEALDHHIAHQREVLAEVGAPVTELVDSVADLLAGGKRLRAAFLYWGYRAFTDHDSDALVRAASAVEVFQAAALLHDDVMDNSDLRRGRPTAHRAFTIRHAEAGWAGASTEFGQAAAILAGDLCLNWCDEIFAGSGLPPEQIARARPVFDTMRTQLMGGQYLDVLQSARDWTALSHDERIAQCRRVIRYKSAKYSVEHPLLIGAHAAGAPAHARAALSRYGLALGEAFQLRDDILGVFGDPGSTGKPAGDDLREGKQTVLMAQALEHGSADDLDALRASVGRPDLTEREVETCRDILRRSGALDRTEQMIDAGCAQARAALATIPDLREEGRHALEDLVAISTARAT
jgi:geranylgeranyl diphosphate synthase type I